MGNHIIETIGKWGVKTRPFQIRAARPGPGDPVDISEFKDIYPFKSEYQYARIAGIRTNETGTKRLSLCCTGGGSHHLFENGEVSVSGGPFVGVDLDWIEPTYLIKAVHFWNWGDHSSGAGMGVDYHVSRPIFKLTKFVEWKP